MFKASTPKIEELARRRPEVIQQLERLLVGRTSMYIDYANVRSWVGRLGWHIDIERLQQFLRSFDNIATTSLYSGTLQGDQQSEDFIKKAERLGYRVRTKPVKIMKISINASSISPQSPDLLKQFIRASLLRELDIKTIEYLNLKLKELNKKGTLYLEERKCNFDVEIGRDMTIDHERKAADCFVLWSGDSDFHDPLKELLIHGRKVILFATARRVAAELNDLKASGLFIFDIAKLRDFICYHRELRA
jgi:uncharacterized LabA/DUF88 family protein